MLVEGNTSAVARIHVWHFLSLPQLWNGCMEPAAVPIIPAESAKLGLWTRARALLRGATGRRLCATSAQAIAPTLGTTYLIHRQNISVGCLGTCCVCSKQHLFLRELNWRSIPTFENRIHCAVSQMMGASCLQQSCGLR